MSRHGTFAFLAAMALLLGAFGAHAQVHAPVVHAAQTWGVVVGGDPTPGITQINFYPSTLTINAGDAVNFTFPAQEPHTVTFDAGNVPGLFVTGLKPNSPNPGDLDATVAFSPANAGGPNISYDGTTVVSSGVPTDAPQDRSPFTVTFPKAGVYYYECAVHGPDMSGEVVVLPAAAATPETPAQATSRGTALAAADVKNTLAIADAFPINPKTTPLANGGTLHELAAGAPGYHLSVSQFLPMDYTVRRGDTITWDQSDIAQFHTVTFLSGAQAPQFLQIIPQPGGPPKIVLPAAVNVPAGGDTYTGTGIVNSGVLTVGTSFTLKIDAPPGTYQYECLFHADDYNMKGTITVTQ